MPSIFFPFRRIFNALRRKRIPRRVRREMEDLRERTARAEADVSAKGDELRDALEQCAQLRTAARSAPICANPGDCSEIAGLKKNIQDLEDKSATVSRDLTSARDERDIAVLRTVELEEELTTSKRERDACAAAVFASSDERRALLRRTEELSGDVNDTERRMVALGALLGTCEDGHEQDSAAGDELARLFEENGALQKRCDEAVQDLANANDDIRDLRCTLQEHLDHLCTWVHLENC